MKPDAPFEALIFDCDGTLADTMPIHHECLATALARHGTTLPWDWYIARNGVAFTAMIDEVKRELGHSPEPDALMAELPQLYRERVHKVEEIAQVAAIARQHAGQVPMAVASNGEAELVHATLDAIGLKDLFQAIVTIEDVAQGKPEPDVYLEAARRLGVEPGLCVVYEDSDVGLEAARRAGMRRIDVRRG